MKHTQAGDIEGLTNKEKMDTEKIYTRRDIHIKRHTHGTEKRYIQSDKHGETYIRSYVRNMYMKETLQRADMLTEGDPPGNYAHKGGLNMKEHAYRRDLYITIKGKRHIGYKMFLINCIYSYQLLTWGLVCLVNKGLIIYISPY